MSATIVRDERQATVPAEVLQAAGLRPGDQVDWRFEQGEIRGRRVTPEAPRAREGKIVEDYQTALVYFQSDVTPQEAESGALSANLNRQ